MNCIIIGLGAGWHMVNGDNVVLIGRATLQDQVHIPDNTLAIPGVFEGVIADDRWPEAVSEAQMEIPLAGVPQAIASLVEPFGIDPDAARKAAAQALADLRHAGPYRLNQGA